MTRPVLRGLIASALIAATAPWAQLTASADPGVDANPSNETMTVRYTEKQKEKLRRQGTTPTSKAPTAPSTEVGPRPRPNYAVVCAVGGDAVCDEPARCDGTGVRYRLTLIYPGGESVPGGFVCIGGENNLRQAAPSAPPEVTNAMVLRALRRVEVPSPKLVVQPPGGKTLVNLDTIFSTDAEPFSATVRLVGRRVDLEITPVTYVWSHGDGTSQRSKEPGRTYAEGVDFSEYLTHVYTDADVTVHPRVSVEYGARFRVDGGRWRDVSGTVTVEGDPVDLRVVEARPELVNAY